MGFEWLEKGGCCIEVIVKSVLFEIDLIYFYEDDRTVIIVTTVGIEMSVLKDLSAWFLKLSDDLVFVPFVILFDLLSDF